MVSLVESFEAQRFFDNAMIDAMMIAGTWKFVTRNSWSSIVANDDAG
jgi:hypothetical protein